MHNTILIGAPIDEGQRRAGCVMGPTAYRVAGLAAAISDCGHGVNDWGDVALPALPVSHDTLLDAWMQVYSTEATENIKNSMVN